MKAVERALLSAFVVSITMIPGCRFDPGGVLVDVPVTAVNPSILVLLDRSGSMTSTFDAASKWDEIGDVWFGTTDGFVKDLEYIGRFGYASFNSGGTCPNLTITDIEFGNYVEVSTAYTNDPAPGSMSPVGDALRAVSSTILSSPDTFKYVILTADGEPNECLVSPEGPLSAAISAAQDLAIAGAKTLVIGLPDAISVSTLQELADAGSGLPGGSTPGADYGFASNIAEYRAAAGDALEAAGLASFTLTGITVDAARVAKMRVTLGGVAIDHDPVNGWTLRSGAGDCFGAAQCITLHGAARDTRFTNSSAILRVRATRDMVH